jgi:alpha-1,2-mannosyltransferase
MAAWRTFVKEPNNRLIWRLPLRQASVTQGGKHLLCASSARDRSSLRGAPKQFVHGRYRWLFTALLCNGAERCFAAKPSTLMLTMRTALKRNLHSLAADLTRKRIRGHAVLLGLVLWGLYAINIATPGLRDRQGQLKGADFLHFYVLGNIARIHDGTMLYDAPRQAALAQQLIRQEPGESYLPVYGPQFSLLFIPFARLPYGWSAAAWMLASALVYSVCCWLMLRVCSHLRDDRTTVLILAAAFPGFFFMVASGQNSALALIAFTIAFFCFRAERPLLAGMALGLLAYKPQFGIMAAAVFVLTLEWKVVAGALITAAGQLTAGALYYGRGTIDSYLKGLTRINQNAVALEPHVDRMHSLQAFWQLLVPWPRIALVLYGATALAAVIVTVWCWKSKAPLQHRYAVFLLGSALVDPHLTDYDLVILVPALMLIGDFVLGSPESPERDAARLLIYAAYFLPLFGTLLKVAHVQLSVLAYAALFLVVAEVIRKQTIETSGPAQEYPTALGA